jgi:hypothetical protein
MRPYPRPLYKSTRVRHFAAGALASFLLFAFLVGVVGCDRTGVAQDGADARGVDVEVDVRPAPCDSTRYEEPPVTERREVDPSGNVRVRVTVRTCCCCCGEKDSYSGYVPPAPITGTGPAPPPTRGPIAPPAVTPPAAPPIAGIPPLRTIPPVRGSFPGGVPVDAPAPFPPVATSSVPWWLSLVAAPLALVSADGSEPFPEGVICGDDSGLPTGPNRPRC